MLCEASWLWEFIQQPTPAPSPPSIAWDEYDKLLKTFKTNDWTKMGDWLRVYNATVVVPFIETLTKMTEQYYLNKIDVSKDGGSIPGIWMRHVLNKVLPKKKRKIELYLPGTVCHYVEINEKNLSTVIATVPWNVVKNVTYICRFYKSVSVKRQ